MADTVYKVRDPSGNMREISGPAGASDDQIIRQAQILFSGNIIPHQNQSPVALPTPEPESLSQQFEQLPYNVGGKITDTLATHVPAEVAAGAGMLGNMAVNAIPAFAGGNIGARVGNLAQNAGTSLMRSALKPSVKDMLSGKGDRAINSMLTADVGNILPGANVSSGGIQQIGQTAGRLGADAEDILRNSNATISRAGVYPPVGETMQKFGNQVNPNADVAAVKDAWGEFLRHPSLQNMGAIPVQLANDLKSGTYKVLGNKAYGEMKGASTEAQKAIARGLRQEIERAVPEVAPINAEQSRLIDALKVASRREAVAGNKDPMALSLLANNPVAGATFMANRSELAKSALARILYSGAPVMRRGGQLAGAYGGANLADQGEE